MTETLEQKVARLEAEKDALLRKVHRPLEFKVSEKGGVSCNGLGRFPVTLYKDQWAKVIDAVPTLKQFLIDHDFELRAKM